MEKLEQLYEGKAKKVFKTDDPDVLIVDYKDDATAFNGEKKGTIVGKGVINNKMSNRVDQLLEKEGVPTHYIEELSDRETAVKKVEIVPLEVIIRNVAAGSFSKRLGVPEGTPFEQPTIEFSYKNDELGDPLINSYFAVAMKLATWEEIETIKKYAFKVNEVLKAYFLQADTWKEGYEIEQVRQDDYDGCFRTEDGVRTAEITITFPEPKKVSHVVLKENIRMSQRIENFEVVAMDLKSGEENAVGCGTVVGYKRIIRFPEIRTNSLTIRITDSRVCPTLSFIGVY